MPPTPSSQPDFSWQQRWSEWARSVEIEKEKKLVVALSGGADSVLLLNALLRSMDSGSMDPGDGPSGRAEPRKVEVLAVHVDHGLRGRESWHDVQFCRAICRDLDVPIVIRRVELDPDVGNLEARARAVRYSALDEEARTFGARVVLAGHHADDLVESLLLRWMRGTDLAGLGGIRARTPIPVPGHAQEVADAEAAGDPILVRPLLSLRRSEVRELLRTHGIAWREDSSNGSDRFARNRVRNALLPRLLEACGPGAHDNLVAFAEAVDKLENQLASRTAHLSWSPLPHAPALRSSRDRHLGGRLERAPLAELPAALQRRALWRLLSEGTGVAPTRTQLESLLQDLSTGAKARRTLTGGWSLHLRATEIILTPSAQIRAQRQREDSAQLEFEFRNDSDPSEEPEAPRGPDRGDRARGADSAAHSAHGDDEDEQEGPDEEPEPGRVRSYSLALPGVVRLPDGRAISGEIVEVESAAEAPRSAIEVELDPSATTGEVESLTVRWALPGDRFHGLGAPGSRPLRRFLADAGIPREERRAVPLVFADDELIWVAGIRPSEPRRVRPGQRRRLRLRMLGAAPEEGVAPEARRPGPLFEPSSQPDSTARGA